jgi:hypothetical protein
MALEETDLLGSSSVTYSLGFCCVINKTLECGWCLKIFSLTLFKASPRQIVWETLSPKTPSQEMAGAGGMAPVVRAPAQQV